ncbi:putative AAA domain-containing protein [Neolecta irregularis DAH-3]|uniref:Putative AAA domain-containing protein n=1 Tax=Neolecta irregularis (strain DAH-3) TaxID=1198029 RepID=A0A1U7LW47_NEOID|nr:putative AAA domain-containing protein [Neolecta irregularis DAH-3]|eukprot:OLL26793.1 putative AAA domain-containing protein [Neolecta irregularis DAH-3]
MVIANGSLVCTLGLHDADFSKDKVDIIPIGAQKHLMPDTRKRKRTDSRNRQSLDSVETSGGHSLRKRDRKIYAESSGSSDFEEISDEQIEVSKRWGNVIKLKVSPAKLRSAQRDSTEPEEESRRSSLLHPVATEESHFNVEDKIHPKKRKSRASVVIKDEDDFDEEEEEQEEDNLREDISDYSAPKPPRLHRGTKKPSRKQPMSERQAGRSRQRLIRNRRPPRKRATSDSSEESYQEDNNSGDPDALDLETSSPEPNNFVDHEILPRGKTRARTRAALQEYETLDDEIAELNDRPRRNQQRQVELRRRKQVNYYIPPADDNMQNMGLGGPSKSRTSGLSKSFFGTVSGFGAMPGYDSSDDELKRGNALGLTPAHITQGTPANLGRVKNINNLADTDPLGVDANVSFESVGGLSDQMVTLPLLYPEIFQKFHITPPRGVLFHGPPGTGKTLMARALAASCSTEGRNISFYMRKGADCLSKWVGEAERQLRLLFEEAKATQPSIIFFDEIDGLAPVRSSKQEQIHASIVSTLLALMDGMDGRGQVIVIGATNRPDSVDSALRRPGRFDREFYFPLPEITARKGIIDIHTKGWDPPLSEDFKKELAQLTKGYGGADLRALCTEAALNAVQRRYPQIYSTVDKLKIDTANIEVKARDFMTAIRKIVPSSERSSTSGAAPLPDHITPLLGETFESIKSSLASMLPEQKRKTVLEESMFEEEGEDGFERETLLQRFEASRVFRPRLLIYGQSGMGQRYLAAAALHFFEGYHVQSLDLGFLMGDSSRTPEAALIQAFVEVRRHKPSVLFIAGLDIWYEAVSETIRSTFSTLLRSLGPADSVLLLGFADCDIDELHPHVKNWFGYSMLGRVEVSSPTRDMIVNYFNSLIGYIAAAPTSLPDAVKRKPRILEELQVVGIEDQNKVFTPKELRALGNKDPQLKRLLKQRLSSFLHLIKQQPSNRKFKKPLIDLDKVNQIEPTPVGDLSEAFGPDTDNPASQMAVITRLEDGKFMENATGKVYHGMSLDVIEERLWNGFYIHPKGFLNDIKLIVEDAEISGNRENAIKAKQMYHNVEWSFDDAFDEHSMTEYSRLEQREIDRRSKYNESYRKELEEAVEADIGNNEQVADHNNDVIMQDEEPETDQQKPNGAGEIFFPPNDQLGTGQTSVLSKAGDDEPASQVIRVDDPPNNNVIPIVPAPALIEQPVPEEKIKGDSSIDPNPSVVFPVPKDPTPSPPSPKPDLEIDRNILRQLHRTFADLTIGFSVEQLEQVNAGCMDAVWRYRSDWNRNNVIRKVEKTLVAIAKEIKSLQKKPEDIYALGS